LAMIAGIGFTVSLFVNNLAFGVDDQHHDDEVAAVVVDGEIGADAPDSLAFVEADDDHADDHGDDHADDEGSSEPQEVQDNAKIGILFASVIASVGGLLILSGGRIDDEDDE